MRALPPFWHAKIKSRQASLQYRQLPRTRQDVDFCSNDYLGLARGAHESITASAGGSTGSRLLSGNSDFILHVEQHIAARLGFDNALIFPSGYSANVGVLSAFADRGVVFIMDELCHASLIDGARLGFAKRAKFRHNDTHSLAQALKRSQAQSSAMIVVVESIYSMDGDIAPLAEIVALCRQYGAELIVDEAHAIGVLGHHGEGMVHQLELQNEVLAVVYTFGKAPGSHGAIIAGAQQVIAYLVNFCRAFIYSTAPSNLHVSEMRQAFDHVIAADAQRAKLQQNIAVFIDCAKRLQLPVLPSNSAIQAIVLGQVEQTKQLAEYLNARGYWLKPILSPTVAPGRERIRICLHAFNEYAQIEGMLGAAHEFLEG